MSKRIYVCVCVYFIITFRLLPMSKRETSGKIVCRRRAEKSDESERESY
jgi:hypothetical protein